MRGRRSRVSFFYTTCSYSTLRLSHTVSRLNGSLPACNNSESRCKWPSWEGTHKLSPWNLTLHIDFTIYSTCTLIETQKSTTMIRWPRPRFTLLLFPRQVMSCDWYENYASRYDRASMSAEVEETSILSRVMCPKLQSNGREKRREGEKKTPPFRSRKKTRKERKKPPLPLLEFEMICGKKHPPRL